MFTLILIAIIDHIPTFSRHRTLSSFVDIPRITVAVRAKIENTVMENRIFKHSRQISGRTFFSGLGAGYSRFI